jgi:2,3-bisphosphoglycerate-independent phosphoglycerate mutase
MNKKTYQELPTKRADELQVNDLIFFFLGQTVDFQAGKDSRNGATPISDTIKSVTTDGVKLVITTHAEHRLLVKVYQQIKLDQSSSTIFDPTKMGLSAEYHKKGQKIKGVGID